MPRIKENLTVGDADVSQTAPSHVPGVRQGNARGSYDRSPGHNPNGTSDARRSTGINPGDRNPILPSMPKLSPA